MKNEYLKQKMPKAVQILNLAQKYSTHGIYCSSSFQTLSRKEGLLQSYFNILRLAPLLWNKLFRCARLKAPKN